MTVGVVSGVNVIQRHARQRARGITGDYTSRNTDNEVFVIRAEPSHKNICLTRNLTAGFYCGDYTCRHHFSIAMMLADTL